MSKDKSGPAFPYTTIESSNRAGIGFSIESKTIGGMTLRQYYICHAPAQEVAELIPSTVGDCAKFIGITFDEYIVAMHYHLVLAKGRCMWADAMIKAGEA